MVVRGRSSLLAVVAALCAGCSHQAIWLGGEPVEVSAPGQPAPLTVALRAGGFERSRLEPAGVLDRFEGALRGSGLFQSIMYPIPAGADPTWEIELSASDSATEPNSNFWKSALASALPPVALFVKLENDYTLRLEALLVRDRVLVKSYGGEAPTRNRYGPYANLAEVSLEGVELAVDGASRQILAALAADLDGLLEADRP